MSLGLALIIIGIVIAIAVHFLLGVIIILAGLVLLLTGSGRL